MKIRTGYLYRFQLSADTLDQYPAVARYETHVGHITSIEDDKLVVQMYNHTLFVSREEVGKELEKVPKLTEIQRAVLKACARKGGAGWADIRRASVSAGGSGGECATDSVLSRLLDKETSATRQTRTMVVRSLAYAEKRGLEYTSRWQCGPGTDRVVVSLAQKRHGYLTRVKVGGKFRYTITTLGRAMLDY